MTISGCRCWRNRWLWGKTDSYVATSQGRGQPFGVCHPAEPRVAVARGEGLVEEHHAGRAVEHQVAGLDGACAVAVRGQALVEIRIFFVAVQFTHLQGQGESGGKGPCGLVVLEGGGKRGAVDGEGNVSAH